MCGRCSYRVYGRAWRAVAEVRGGVWWCVAVWGLCVLLDYCVVDGDVRCVVVLLLVVVRVGVLGGDCCVIVLWFV